MAQDCIKCGVEPRQGTTKWGANCWREYRANRRQTQTVAQTVTVAERAEEADGDSVAPGNIGEEPTRSDHRDLVWPEGSEFEPAEGVHCETCGHPAGRYTPPLDEREDGRRWRVLGSDPRGWDKKTCLLCLSRRVNRS